MCGRFSLTSTEGLVDEFELIEPITLAPRYNIAPTDSVSIISNRGERRVELARWGLIPHWANDLAIGAKMINARSETLAEKPAFRDAFSRRRCLVPADGFFEWRRDGKKRIPHYMRRADHGVFAFAGLWARKKVAEDEWLISCTVITGEPNDLIAPLHDRMPIIVPRDDYSRWLHPDPLPPDALDDILRPAAAAGFELFEVSQVVNSVRNDEPECVERWIPRQGSLF
jgi:putative SOS response-associated peptidase YedK